MMRKLFAVVGILLAGALNAQWDTLNTGVNTKFTGIAFLNGSTGVAAGHSQTGSSGNIALVTNDRGNTWQTYIGSESGDHEYTDVTFTPIGTIWILGDSGLVLHKNFPLTSHICDTNLTSYRLHCGTAVNDSAFYCAGEYGTLFRTLDRGLTWTTLSAGTTETINDIYFNGASDGWIVCDDGYMAVTGDSGNTWQFVAQPMWGFVDIKSFDYQDSVAINPYLVGSNGIANFSIDAGQNWANIATGTTNTLNKIRFGTNNAGLIVGDNGYIFRTENAGWSWFADSSSENVDFFDIAYAGDTTAFICGDSGVVLRSNVNISSVQPHEIRSFSAGAYPNPSTGPLNLQLMLAVEADITIDVLNITGEIIVTEYHENVRAGENVLPINLQSQAEGMYFVRVSNGYSAVTMRVVKQ